MTASSRSLATDNPRTRYARGVFAIVGQQNVRILWVPSDSEALVHQDLAVATRLWTHATSPRGRIKRVGALWGLDFNGTSDYLSTPDADDLSFGNGTVDSPFSVFAAFNVTDTAASRQILSKHETGATEWRWNIASTDQNLLVVTDNSVPAQAFRQTDAAITQGSWVTLAATYSAATGGATAANDMTMYQNGVSVASTATNSGTYVAEESLTSAVLLGAIVPSAPSSFFSGSMAAVLLVAGALTADQNLQLHNLSRSFGLVA